MTPGSNVLRAEIQRALRRAPRQLRRLRLGLQTRRGSNHSAAHVGESNSRSNVLQNCCACVPSRWKVLSGEFRRRPTALAIKFRNPDRVGRRGLSEPREDFSRLPTFAFPRLCPRLESVSQFRVSIPSYFNLRAQPLESSLGRVPQAADDTCNKISQIGSCRSPRTV